MNDRNAEFLREYSPNFLEMALNGNNRQIVKNPDGYGKLSRECGDTVEIFLTLRDERIWSATFESDGCLYSVVCANAVAHLATDLTPEQAWGITPQHIVDLLETLPPEEVHCAEQAVSTLRLALKDLHDTERRPWKKFYHKR